MTIKEFASLCGCNAQTLRYYDKIDLLKPSKVDPWSGYRYYEKNQAVTFVKIKNLQAADFSIDEIKLLLTLSDRQVYEAFDRKITEQSQKLERIKEIQRSYLTEKSNMEKLIHNLSDYLLHAISDYELLREFGMAPDDGPLVVAKLKEYIEASTRRHLDGEPDIRMIVDDQVICGVDHIADAFAELKEKGYDPTVLLGDEAVGEEDGFTLENSEEIWACHGWRHVHEFLEDIPPMEEHRDYCCCFELTEDKYQEGLEFPMFMIASMLPRIDGDETVVGCMVQRSRDGENHFSLLRRI